MCKNKASENPFNISKNQELELFLSCHFKNLISPKPIEQSVESYFIDKIKVIVSTGHTLVCPYFSFIIKKKIFLRKSKPGHGYLVQYFNLNDNFDDVRSKFLPFLAYYKFSRALCCDEARHYGTNKYLQLKFTTVLLCNYLTTLVKLTD